MLDNSFIECGEPAQARLGGAARTLKWMPVLVIVLAFLAAPFAGPAAEIFAGPSDDALIAGAEVYNESCAACHQAGGAGVPGQFPPLAGNPSVDDTEYMETVIKNGLSGEIEVNGQTYNGVMPASSAMSDDDVASVIAYVQSGFATPQAEVPEVVLDSSGGSRSPLTIALYVMFGLAAVLGATVFRSRIVAVNGPREVSWSDAWMKTGVIVVGLILVTTMVPVWAWESGTLQDLSSVTRDLITIGVWTVGLTGSLFLLWYFHRKNRV